MTKCFPGVMTGPGRPAIRPRRSPRAGRWVVLQRGWTHLHEVAQLVGQVRGGGVPADHWLLIARCFGDLGTRSTDPALRIRRGPDNSHQRNLDRSSMVPWGPVPVHCLGIVTGCVAVVPGRARPVS